MMIVKGMINGLRCEVHETPARRSNPSFVRAVCKITDDDALIFGKAYKIRLFPNGTVLVTDENGEATVCDRKDFDF